MTEVSAVPFTRPPYCASATHVDVGVTYAALEACDSYATWHARVAGELQVAYGWANADGRIACISYSTRKNPNTFASDVDEKLFEKIHTFHEASREWETLSAQYSAALEAQTPPEAEENSPKRLTRREREAQEKARRELRVMKRRLAEAEAKRDYEAKKLENAMDMCTVRIYVK